MENFKGTALSLVYAFSTQSGLKMLWHVWFETRSIAAFKSLKCTCNPSLTELDSGSRDNREKIVRFKEKSISTLAATFSLKQENKSKSDISHVSYINEK